MCSPCARPLEALDGRVTPSPSSPVSWVSREPRCWQGGGHTAALYPGDQLALPGLLSLLQTWKAQLPPVTPQHEPPLRALHWVSHKPVSRRMQAAVTKVT